MAAVSQVTNLGELKDYVADELDRTDLDTVIAAWPSLVEAELHRKIVDGEPFRHWRMILTDTLDVEEDTALVALPNATDNSGDWLETISLRWNTYNCVYNSPGLINIQKRTFATSGEPALTEIDPRFTYRGANFELWPTPDADGTLEVEYYAKIPSMNGDGETNWLLDHAPDVYIYGCLKHSAPYLRDDERIVLWDKLFEDAVFALQMESRQARQSGSRMTRPAPVAF